MTQDKTVQYAFNFQDNGRKKMNMSGWKFVDGVSKKPQQKMESRKVGYGYASHWKLDNTNRSSPDLSIATKTQQPQKQTTSNTMDRDVHKYMFEQLVGFKECDRIDKQYKMSRTRRCCDGRRIPVTITDLLN
jgi:hypothetical protein